MADPVLAVGQYSLGSDGDPAPVIFGYGTPVLISKTETDTGTAVVQDTAVTGHDGVLFGTDTMQGQTITFTGQVYQPSDGKGALDIYSVLAGKWNDPAVRLASGAVQVLRARYAISSVTRRAYGRGRKIQPALGQAFTGLVPFTAQFAGADPIWYADDESSLVLTTVPSYLGTLTFPLTPPFQWASQINYQQNTLVNTGSMPTWPVITFTGPISSPSLSYNALPVSVGYSGTLGPADHLVIDTRPWARTALLNGASVAGLLTGDPMISLQLQPGATVARLGGTDYTGTSTCVIRWRNAWLAIGGTTA